MSGASSDKTILALPNPIEFLSYLRDKHFKHASKTSVLEDITDISQIVKRFVRETGRALELERLERRVRGVLGFQAASSKVPDAVYSLRQ